MIRKKIGRMQWKRARKRIITLSKFHAILELFVIKWGRRSAGNDREIKVIKWLSRWFWNIRDKKYKESLKRKKLKGRSYTFNLFWPSPLNSGGNTLGTRSCEHIPRSPLSPEACNFVNYVKPNPMYNGWVGNVAAWWYKVSLKSERKESALPHDNHLEFPPTVQSFRFDESHSRWRECNGAGGWERTTPIWHTVERVILNLPEPWPTTSMILTTFCTDVKAASRDAALYTCIELK